MRSVVRSHVLGVTDGPASGSPSDVARGPGDGTGRPAGPPQVGLAGMAFMNSVAYRAAVPSAVLVKEGMKTDVRGRPHCWIGPEQVSDSSCSGGVGNGSGVVILQRQHIVTFPLRDGEMVGILFSCVIVLFLLLTHVTPGNFFQDPCCCIP